MKLLSSVLAVIMFVSASAFAGEATQTSIKKLSNVVNNSLPREYRDNLNIKTEQLRASVELVEDQLKSLENIANNNLPSQYRGDVLAKINTLKQSIASDIAGQIVVQQPSQPSQPKQYCTAACTSAFGSLDTLSRPAGASDFSKLVAQQKAVDAKRAQNTCSYGIANVACEEEQPNRAPVTCQAACLSAFGSLTSGGTTKIGQGATRLEAEVNAREALNKENVCSYGTGITVCE